MEKLGKRKNVNVMQFIKDLKKKKKKDTFKIMKLA